MKRLLLLSVILGLLGHLPGFLDQARADCGPGPVIVQDSKGWLLQSIGATTNATSLGTQTFAIMSGTSGCSNSGIINNEYEQRVFVAVHMDNIYTQMAQGQGAHLDALASLMGCQVEDYSRFADMTRQKLDLLLPATEIQPGRLLARLKEEMRGDALLAKGCSRIS